MNVMLQVPVLKQNQDIAFTYWMKDVPENELAVTAFAVDEAIFGMTRIEIMLASVRDDIDLRALIDTGGTLTIHHKYLETLRHFSGIVVEAERGDTGHHYTSYRLVLMPALYRLDHGSDCRIFQQKSVPDIVKEIFSEQGIENVVWNISQQHLTREYCVQYRESHLAFIERIMAEEGIFYYFEHDKAGVLRLVISDQPMANHDCPGLETLTYNAMASGAVKGVYCSSLTYREKLRSTTFVQRDYTFKKPEYNQQHKEKAPAAGGEKHDYELYDYPGRYKEEAVGKPFTRHKLEATRVDANLGYGVANAPHLLSGHNFTLTEHPNKNLNRKWRVLTLRHEGLQPQAWEGDAQGTPIADTGLVAPGLAGSAMSGLSFGISGSQSANMLSQMLVRRMNLALQSAQGEDAAAATIYACAFAAQPANMPYRPPQMLKPRVDGPQMAIVVGPPGEEIHTDKYGRVKVHFPWDRHKEPKAEDSSCWIRVASNWAGGKWGHVAIPRIGHEVIVDFLEGDPDQPIVTGRTFHETNQPPYNLPAEKTKMVIRSDTHKGQGFNEVSFEDDRGKENIYVHAQRNMEVHVENCYATRVDINYALSVGHDKRLDTGNHHRETVGGNMSLWVGANATRQWTRSDWEAFTREIPCLNHNIPNLNGSMPSLNGSLTVPFDAWYPGDDHGYIETGLDSDGGNMSVVVVKNKAEIVGISSSHITGINTNRIVGVNSNDIVGLNSNEIVGVNYNEIVGLNSNEIVGGLKTISVLGAKNEAVGLASLEEVGGLKSTLVGGAHTLHVGAASLETVGALKSFIVGESFQIICGRSKLVMFAGGLILLEGTSINLVADEIKLN